MRQKGKFLTFCCSLFPGAGQMYLGFMRLGISLMGLFWGIIGFGALINLGVLYFLLPVIWCYSFFDAINKNSMDEEEFYELEDQYLFNMNFSDISALAQGKYRTIFAIVLLVIGIAMLLSNVMGFLSVILPWKLYVGLELLLRYIPRICMALLVIWIGMHLIQGKRLELNPHIKEKIFIRTEPYGHEEEKSMDAGNQKEEEWRGVVLDGENQKKDTDKTSEGNM